MTRGRGSAESGQAAIEVLAAAPALLALGLVVLQLLAVGYAGVLAGGAAEAGALALAGGGDAEQRVRDSLPGWSRARARVVVSRDTVRVRLRPPSPLSSLSRRLEVSAGGVRRRPVSAHESLGSHRRLLSGALAGAADWLVAPAEPAGAGADPAPLEARAVVAVLGLTARCGATTVARALGAELAARDPNGACAVTASVPAGALALGFPAAGRLARTLSPLAGVRARPWGRLCLVEAPDRAALAAAARHLTPLVIDVERDGEASLVAALADHVVLVAAPDTEPALAAVVCASLAALGPEPVTVLNRPRHDRGRWAGRAAAELPESRAGAGLALVGREARGAFGAAVAELADECERPG